MRLRILSTSDVHGNIYPTNFATKDAYNPFGYLKDIAMIKQIRQQYLDDIVVYIENGDFIEGAPMSSYAFKTQATDHFDQMFKELTQEVEADVGILGNHEFNYGKTLPILYSLPIFWKMVSLYLLRILLLKNKASKLES